MKKLKHIGFFKELSHGEEDGGSIKSYISKMNHPKKTEIVDYLRNGATLIASPGLAKDVLSDSSEIIDELCILTDGQWAWPNDLAYYVEKYSVGLNDEFVQWMQMQNWHVPDDLVLEALEF